ncbi:hypothetical protein QZH41_009469, partial [Actinostola sp. cb2023]
RLELKKVRVELHLPSLIELGTCGLHTFHRAFQTGAKETDWNLDRYLLKEYKLFKDSPARREDYVNYTGVDIFPSKFCNHRWLENLPVANKSLTLLPHVRQYCKQAALDKTEPKKHEGYQYVSKLCQYRHFVKSKAPFLDMFGTGFPTIPTHVPG